MDSFTTLELTSSEPTLQWEDLFESFDSESTQTSSPSCPVDQEQHGAGVRSEFYLVCIQTSPKFSSEPSPAHKRNTNSFTAMDTFETLILDSFSDTSSQQIFSVITSFPLERSAFDVSPPPSPSPSSSSSSMIPVDADSNNGQFQAYCVIS
ncbi:hypothetical protein C8Q75DRAFT_892208 [Abortiporus biennis]|nr:hypothetical protein C8Q75DRAFT_892208 [Abortiporus biennis]